MNGKELQELAAARAEKLPGAGLERPFGADWDVFKVREKVFMLLTQVVVEKLSKARQPVDPSRFGQRNS